jgi:hypothetical protein
MNLKSAIAALVVEGSSRVHGLWAGSPDRWQIKCHALENAAAKPAVNTSILVADLKSRDCDPTKSKLRAWQSFVVKNNL